MKKTIFRTITVLLLFTYANLSIANEINSKDITISNSWIRTPSETSKNTAAYLTIENKSDFDIKLVDIKTEKPIAKKLEIHGYKPNDEGVMKMFKLESVTIPSKSKIEFKPRADHIMLMDIENRKDQVRNLENRIIKNKNYNMNLHFMRATLHNEETTTSSSANSHTIISSQFQAR